MGREGENYNDSEILKKLHANVYNVKYPGRDIIKKKKNIIENTRDTKGNVIKSGTKYGRVMDGIRANEMRNKPNVERD